MDTSEFIGGVTEALKTMGRRAEILVALYPDKQLPQGALAEVTGINEGNLSRYVRELNEKGHVLVESNTSEAGRSTNIVSLTDRSRMILTRVQETRYIGDRKFVDEGLIENLCEMMLDPDITELAVDEIQILSRKHLITTDSRFFTFLKTQIDDRNVRRRIRVLLNSAQYFMHGMTEEERRRVHETINDTLMRVLEESEFSNSDRKEVAQILELSGVPELGYEYLKERYLALIGEDPGFVRDALCSSYPDMLLELRLSLITLYKSAPEYLRPKIREELSRLR